MGRHRGEPLVRIVDVRVLAGRRERLDEITSDEVLAEGFPEISPPDFIEIWGQGRPCAAAGPG